MELEGQIAMEYKTFPHKVFTTATKHEGGIMLKACFCLSKKDHILGPVIQSKSSVQVIYKYKHNNKHKYKPFIEAFRLVLLYTW